MEVFAGMLGLQSVEQLPTGQRLKHAGGAGMLRQPPDLLFVPNPEVPIFQIGYGKL